MRFGKLISRSLVLFLASLKPPDDGVQRIRWPGILTTWENRVSHAVLDHDVGLSSLSSGASRGGFSHLHGACICMQPHADAMQMKCKYHANTLHKYLHPAESAA